MKKQSKNEKILILRTEHIGDFILSMPVFYEIRKKFPKAHITIVLRDANLELAEKAGIFDKIICYQDPLAERKFSKLSLLTSPRDILSISKQILRYLHEKYDLFIEFSGREYNKFYSKFIRAGLKVVEDKKIDEEEPESDRLFSVVRRLGIKKPTKLKFITVSEQAEKKVSSILSKRQKNIAVHIKTPLDEKNWPIENFYHLFRKLNRFRFYIIGGDARQNLTKSENVTDLSGKLNLEESFCLIKNSDLFIGLDSAPMHLAEFTSTPIIALFGPTKEKRWGPTRRNSKVVKNENIKEIEVKEVLKLIK